MHNCRQRATASFRGRWRACVSPKTAAARAMGTTWSRGEASAAARLQVFASDWSMSSTDGDEPDVTHVRFELVTHGDDGDANGTGEDAEAGYEPDGRFVTEIQRPEMGQRAVLRFNTLALHVLADGSMKLYDQTPRQEESA